MTPVEPANPHGGGTDEAALWDICVKRDILGFAAADWAVCEGDFAAEGFAGWDARFSADPLAWQMTYPSLASYRDAWLTEARAFARRTWRVPLARDLFASMSLARIDVEGDAAIVHKRFDGRLHPADGEPIPLQWQSLFHLRRAGGRWVQRGFIGYLPL